MDMRSRGNLVVDPELRLGLEILQGRNQYWRKVCRQESRTYIGFRRGSKYTYSMYVGFGNQKSHQG